MKNLLLLIVLMSISLVSADAQTLLECTKSPTNARIDYVSQSGDIIYLKVYWDEGSTFSSSALKIENGTCASCPRIGGIGRPHGTVKTYQIKKTDPTKPVKIAWNSTGYCGNEEAVASILPCTGSKSNAKIALDSKSGNTINLKVDWDEGATLSEASLIVSNANCESCPRIGGIGRPHGTNNTYTLKQQNTSIPVVIRWKHAYCGTDQALSIK